MSKTLVWRVPMIRGCSNGPHDVATITHYAYVRVRQGKPMPGVIEVAPTLAVGEVIEDLLLVAEATLKNELEGQIVYLPLR